MADETSTPSEIQAELQKVEKLVSELPKPVTATPMVPASQSITLAELMDIAAPFYGAHPAFQQLVQAVNRKLANG